LIYFTCVVAILMAGLVLMIVAERREWAPALWITLVVAALVRIAIVVLSARSPQSAEVAGFVQPAFGQPLDFGWGMPLVGETLLEGRDPEVSYFPLLTYIYAAQVALVYWTGISWIFIGKIYAVASDVVLVYLIGRLAQDRPLLRSWQYAWLPLALLVTGIHGQMEPFVLVFGVAALLQARRNRPSMAGAMLGIAIAAKTWPVLIGAGLLKALRDNSARFRAVTVAAAVPILFLVTYRFVVESSITESLGRVAGYASYAGEWGWTGLIRVATDYYRFQELADGLESIGRWITLAALGLAWVVWKRAHSVDLTAALLLTFLIFTPGFGAQYLLWPVPFLLARPTRRTVPFLAIASVWAAVGYLIVGDFGYYTLWRHSGWWDYETVHLPWVASSVLVILACFAAFPWERRRVSPRRPTERLTPRPDAAERLSG